MRYRNGTLPPAPQTYTGFSSYIEGQAGAPPVHHPGAGYTDGDLGSGSNREAESTDAPERGGLPRSSDEAG